MARIEIDHLEIRVKNISQDTINSMVEELGANILERLDRILIESGAQKSFGGQMTIDRLDAGIVNCGGSSAPHDLQGTIADSVARSISTSLHRSRSGSILGTRSTATSNPDPNG
jgi:hypothetical protein